METEIGFPKQWKEVDVLAKSKVRKRLLWGKRAADNITKNFV